VSHSPVDNQSDDPRADYNLGWRRMTQQIEDGGSWSGRERNCCFLNTGSAGFADVSAATGLDFDDDGRTVAVTDWDHDGDQDVWLTGRTSPRIRFMRNNLAGGARFVNVRLQGRRCNRDAIGARIELHLAEPSSRTLVRTLRAGDAFLSQSSRWAHFGLGNATTIRKLVVYWPGSDGAADRAPQVLEGLECDTWYTILQDADAPEVWSPPARTINLQPAPLAEPEARMPERIVLLNRVPLPPLTCTGSDGRTMQLADSTSAPLLINLWATWCVPCLEELGQFARNRDKLNAAGVNIVAINVDGIADENPGDPVRPAEVLRRVKFPFAPEFANPEMFDKLDVIHDVVLSLRANRDDSLSLPVPVSFLIDRQYRVAVIYRGAVPVDQLLADVERLDSARQPLDAVPFSGRWYLQPGGSSALLARFADRFGRRGYFDDADRFASLAADLASREGVAYEINDQLANVFSNLGDIHLRQGRPAESIRSYRRALEMKPNQSRVHNDLGRALASQGQIEAATEHFSAAVRIDPHNDAARSNLNAIRNQRIAGQALPAELER